MSKGFTGLNPGNQAFKQFKCPVFNVLIYAGLAEQQLYIVNSTVFVTGTLKDGLQNE